MELKSQKPATLTQFGPSMGSGVRVVINSAVRLTEGSVEGLWGIKTAAIEFDYSQMAVCEFSSEQEFLEDYRKKHKKNKADKFIAKWRALPITQLEPRFARYFNESALHFEIVDSSHFHLTEVKLIIQVLQEDPHIHRDHPERMLPFVYLFGTFINKEGDLIARFELTAFGSRDKDSASRLTECYAIAGKMLARNIEKQFKMLQKYYRNEQILINDQ